MPLELKQNLKLQQQLKITLQLQQAIKLLQLSRYELADVISQELMENPVLEERLLGPDKEAKPGEVDTRTPEDAAAPVLAGGETPVEARADGEEPSNRTEDEFQWDKYLDGYINSRGSEGSFGRPNLDDLPSQDRRLHTKTELKDHLLWQLRLGDFDDEERNIGVFVIGNIDDDGLVMRDDPAEDVTASIAAACETTPEKVERVLARIQLFDPVGVASRDVRECLLVQARHYAPTNALIQRILEEHYDDLQKMKFQQIARDCGADLETVREAVRVISRFETRPGRLYSTAEPHYITPDLYIEKVGGEYKIIVNDEGIPRLRINAFYRNYLRNRSRDETSKFIREKLNAAKWFINSIDQRRRTMYKVMDAILRLQRDFFERGVEHLKPLYLKDIAREIGMHESTVCRVTNSKYVHTPQGLFELKYFFNSGLATADGGDVASKAVKSRITKLLESESDGKSLSDREVVALLARDGIKIARRTVAKYRGQLGIMSSSKRNKRL